MFFQVLSREHTRIQKLLGRSNAVADGFIAELDAVHRGGCSNVLRDCTATFQCPSLQISAVTEYTHVEAKAGVAETASSMSKTEEETKQQDV